MPKKLKPPNIGKLTENGYWRMFVGDRLCAVAVGEYNGAGENVSIRYRDELGERRRGLGFSVRDRRGQFDPDALREAKDKAERLWADRRMGHLTGYNTTDDFAPFPSEEVRERANTRARVSRGSRQVRYKSGERSCAATAPTGRAR